MVEDKFKKTCEVMGGEYSEEEGYLEPDVGGEYAETHEARKQWCTLKNRPTDKGDITVFNARNTFGIVVKDEGNKAILELWDNDVEKKFVPEEHKMVFKTEFGTRVPKGKYVIWRYPPNIREGYPHGELNMGLKPHDDPVD